MIFIKVLEFVFISIVLAADSTKAVENVLSATGKDVVETIVEQEGYPVEKHRVTSEDGYLLTLHRIPYSPRTGPPTTRGVVFVQHGLLCSSVDWVIMGQHKSLGFMLSDAGYDVWMGNARGNTFSRNHTTLDPNNKADKAKFWAFSWNEIGMYDLPAMIDYVLNATGEQKLSYAGHSQGTTAFFVMASEKPEYNAKIKSMHALAPVAYMSHMTSPIVRAMAPFIDVTEFVAEAFGINEFLPTSRFMVELTRRLCREESSTQIVCSSIIFLLCGFNSDQLNTTALPIILQNTPAGASTRQIIHYTQEVRSGKFCKYDFGRRKNNEIYGQPSPPEYQLQRITCPVALHYSENDWMANVQDVDELARRLPNLIGKFLVPHARWNHLDYQWGIDADILLYTRAINLMNRYA